MQGSELAPAARHAPACAAAQVEASDGSGNTAQLMQQVMYSDGRGVGMQQQEQAHLYYQEQQRQQQQQQEQQEQQQQYYQ